jgi:hypothetical protein
MITLDKFKENMKKAYFVESLPQEVLKVAIEAHKKVIADTGIYTDEEKEEKIQFFLDSKIDDVEDSVPDDVYKYMLANR